MDQTVFKFMFYLLLKLSVVLRVLRRYRARQLFGKKLICFCCFARPRLRRPSPTARGRAKQQKQISFLPNKCARRSPTGATWRQWCYCFFLITYSKDTWSNIKNPVLIKNTDFIYSPWIAGNRQWIQPCKRLRMGCFQVVTDLTQVTVCPLARVRYRLNCLNGLK